MELNLLKKNEEQVNKLVNKLMLILLGALILGYISVIIQKRVLVFNLENILRFVSWIFLLVPSIYYKVAHDKSKFKYITIVCLNVICIFLYLSSWIYVSLCWVIPAVIACLYFDQKLTKWLLIINLPLMILCNIVEVILYPNYTIQATNMTAVWFSIYFFIQMILIGLMLISVTKRSKDMLYKSQELANEVNILFDKSMQSSEHLSESVETLNVDIVSSTEVAMQISCSLENFADDTRKVFQSAEEASKSAGEIASGIEEITVKVENISENTKKISETSTYNKEKLLRSIEEMESIEQSTKKTKQDVEVLVNRTLEIDNALSLINNIAKQTNLLALNASIEAARAGEEGKGFSVVASEIKKLADQSWKSSESISDILKVVVGDTQNAVNSIENTNAIVNNNVQSIKNTAGSFDEMFNMQREILVQIQGIVELVVGLNARGEAITSIMDNLKNKNENNCREIETVSASVEELNATFNEIAVVVGNVNKKAKELANIKMD